MTSVPDPNPQLLGCGAKACVFTPVPEICGTVDNHVLRLPKSKAAENEVTRDLSEFDPDQRFSLYQSHPCMIDYELYQKYMSVSERSAKSIEKFSKSDRIAATVLLNGGVSLKSLIGDGKTPSTEFYRALVQVLEGITIMNDHMLFHMDLHEENVVIDATGQSRIIDFGSAIDARSDGPKGVQKLTNYIKTVIPFTWKGLVTDENTQPELFLYKYRHYIDFVAFLGILTDVVDMYGLQNPPSISHFIDVVTKGHIDARNALPLYQQAVHEIPQ